MRQHDRAPIAEMQNLNMLERPRLHNLDAKTLLPNANPVLHMAKNQIVQVDHASP